MALSKTLEVVNKSGLGTGVNATYWVLDRIDFHLISGTTSALLNGYASSAAFAGGKSYIDTRSFEAPTPGSFASLTGTQLVSAVYTYIQSQPEFTGATIVA